MLLFTISCACTLVKAQDISLGTLKGTVKDEATDEPVDFAAVSLYQQDSKDPIKNLMTDISGAFLFKDVPLDVYQVKISFIGYEVFFRDNIMISKEDPELNLGDIKLKPMGNTLKEVVVTDQKQAIEFGADTITFNVSQSMLAEGSTASDLLKNVPMVDVDIDGKPTIAGKVNTRIFIDGKPSDFTAETMTDLLNVLPSDAIEKIEVVTNPDVRYSADGDGIINIVLKKGYTLGLNGALSLTGGTIGNYNASLYTAYSNKKVSLTNTYGFRDTRNISNVSSLRSNFNREEIISSYMNQFSDAFSNGKSHNLRSAVNWDITPKQNIRFSANYNNSSNSGLSHLDDYRLNASAVETQLRVQDTESGSQTANFSATADYTFKINKKNESLVAGLTFFNNNSLRDRVLDRFYRSPDDVISNRFNQQNENDIFNNRLEFNVDYVKPVTKLATLTLGTQLTINNNSNNQFATGYDFENYADTIIPVLTNDFKYQERILALYSSYRFRTKSRWSFRAGVRSEYTNLDFKQAANLQSNPDPYINLFPNFSINKLIKKKYNFGLSYSMRIARPREYALNPLINDANQSNVSFGNPNLQPSYTNQFQLSFGTFGQKWSFTPRISYGTTEKIIERYRISADSLTYGNLGSNQTLTFSLFGNYRPTKKTTLTGGYTLSRRAYQSDSELLPDRVGLSHRANLNASAQFPHKISFEAQVNYFTNALAQGRTSGSVTTSFGARKTFMNNKFLIRFMATDPFRQRNSLELADVLTTTGSYSQERNRIINTRNYSATISYRFSNSNKRKKVEEALGEKPKQ